MHNVLIVARHFPPTNHVSVERVTKLVKYLPHFGWQPTVLTGYRSHGFIEDAALLQQVKHATILRCLAPDLFALYDHLRNMIRHKPRTTASNIAERHSRSRGLWHPKSWLVPDSQILWLPFAVRTARRAARQQRWDVVFATTPPPTAVLVAYQVARRLGLPLVLDYRDPWNGYYAAPHRPWFLTAFERQLEANVFAAASATIAVDPTCVAVPMQTVPASRRPPIHIVPNGFDEEDFLDVKPMELPVFSIVHTGQLRRTVRPLWAALTHVLEANPALRGRLHVWQVGSVDGVVARELAAAPAGVVVHTVPPVPMHEAIRYMVSADLLFVEGIDNILNSKTYQYIRAGRPILALVDTGEQTKTLLEQTGAGRAFYPHEVALASDFILQHVACLQRRPPPPPGPLVTQYSRREMTSKVADVLRSVVLSQ